MQFRFWNWSVRDRIINLTWLPVKAPGKIYWPYKFWCFGVLNSTRLSIVLEVDEWTLLNGFNVEKRESNGVEVIGPSVSCSADWCQIPSTIWKSCTYTRKYKISIFKNKMWKTSLLFCPIKLKFIAMKRDRSVLANNNTLFSFHSLYLAIQAHNMYSSGSAGVKGAPPPCTSSKL